jgi:mRNA degradation ribonuclease J1/J2
MQSCSHFAISGHCRSSDDYLLIETEKPSYSYPHSRLKVYWQDQRTKIRQGGKGEQCQVLAKRWTILPGGGHAKLYWQAKKKMLKQV